MNTENRLSRSIDTKVTLDDVDIDGFKVHFATAGAGQPLLLIHGANIGWGQWYPNIAQLAKYFKVYAIDLPGSGRSTSINFRHADPEKNFVDVVHKFIKINHLGSVNIVGHSIGAWVGLRLALRDSSVIDKLVLVSPMGFSNYVPLHHRLLGSYLFAKIISKTAMRPSRKNMKNFLTSVTINACPITEEFIDYFYENVNRDKYSHPFLFINSILRGYKMREEFLLLDDVAKIQNSALIIAGSDDPLIPFNRASKGFKLMPNAKIEVLSNTGHVPFLEKSKEFNSLVVNYLTS